MMIELENCLDWQGRVCLGGRICQSMLAMAKET